RAPPPPLPAPRALPVRGTPLPATRRPVPGRPPRAALPGDRRQWDRARESPVQLAGLAAEGRNDLPVCKSLLRSRRSIAGARFGRQPPEALVFPGPRRGEDRPAGTFRGGHGLS